MARPQLTTLNALAAYSGYASDKLDSTNSGVIVAQGQPHPDARILVQQDTTPLVLRVNDGAGLVDYLTLDPGNEPFKSWGHRAQAWDMLLTTNVRHPAWANGIVQPERAGNAANFIKGLRLPDIFQIGRVPGRLCDPDWTAELPDLAAL